MTCKTFFHPAKTHQIRHFSTKISQSKNHRPMMHKFVAIRKGDIEANFIQLIDHEVNFYDAFTKSEIDKYSKIEQRGTLFLTKSR